MLISLTALIFIGCGDDAPKCDSKEAKQLVKQILTDHSGLVFLIKEQGKTVTLENILTENVNKEIKNANCSADVLLDGEKFYRALYKLSITSDGKLYAQLKRQ